MVIFIRRLPLDILLQVVAYLSTADLLALRLVYKDLDTLLYQSFAQQYSTKRRFSALTLFSLLLSKTATML